METWVLYNPVSLTEGFYCIFPPKKPKLELRGEQKVKDRK